MPGAFKARVSFVNVGIGAQATLPHGLHVNGRAVEPDEVTMANGSFVVVRALTDATNLTIQNNGAAPADCDVLCEHWHSLERGFGSEAITDLGNRPFQGNEVSGLPPNVVTSTLVIGDNDVVRGDGGVRGVQGSLVDLADDGTMTFPDDAATEWGSAGDSSLGYYTGQTPNSVVFGLPGTSNALTLCQQADIATDWAHVELDPTLFIQSRNATPAQHVSISHDTTKGILAIGAGNFLLDSPGSIELQSAGAAGDITLDATRNVLLESGAGRGVYVTPESPNFVTPDPSFTIDTPGQTNCPAGVEVIHVRVDNATTQWSTGAIASQRFTYFDAPTCAFTGGSVITDAATVYIAGGPASGANCTITNPAWSLWTGSSIRVDGSVCMSGGVVFNSYTAPFDRIYRSAAQRINIEANSIELAEFAQDVGIRINPPSAGMTIFQQGTTGVTPDPALYVNPGGHTTMPAGVEYVGIVFGGFNDLQWATGALATERYIRVARPKFNFVGASTITDAATFYIENDPFPGTNCTITNSYAFWVNAGLSRLDEGVWILDDGPLDLGDAKDSRLIHDTNQTPDSLVLGLGAESNSLTICQKADMTTDWANTATTPTLFIQNSDHTSPNKVIAIYHDGNRGVILVPGFGGGDLYLQTSGYVQFGSYAAVGAETFQGFVTIRDAGGALRKLMVCA